MALFDTVWYVNFGNGSSTGHYALAQWAANTAYAVGNLRRQLAAPAVGSERVFICVVAGTSHLTTEPSWTLTRGAKTTDNTVTWQECSGIACLNGDVTNTPLSSALRSNNATLGATVKNNAGTHLFICTTAGNTGAGEPSYSTTTGATTTDSAATWTCVGAINAFAGGAAPHARVRNALATGWFVNGSKVFVGDNSAETQAAAYSITVGQGTVPLYLLSHDHTTNYPPTNADLSAVPSATITTTGANGISLASTGGAVYHGIKFQAGSGAVNSGITFDGGGFQRFVNCSLEKLGTTGNGAAIAFTTWQIVEMINTTVKFGSTTDSIRPSFARFIWRDTPGGILASGSAVPTRLLLHNLTLGQVAPFRLEGLDLSAIVGTIYTLHTSNFGAAQGPSLIKNCKIATGAVISEAPFGANDGPIDIVRCSDTAGKLVSERFMYGGKQSLETTIVRTGGASDGVTPYAWKVVTTSGNVWQLPFECQPISVMNETVGSPVTVTIEGVWGGGAVPNNDDIWIEAVYLSSTSTPISSRVSGGKASILSSSAALAASSETWGGSTTKFKMSVTFTPQQVGPVDVYIRVGDASATYYVDPKPVLS